MEINVIISAPGLEAALNNFAVSLGARNHIAQAPAIPVAPQAAPAMQVMPTPVPAPSMPAEIVTAPPVYVAPTAPVYVAPAAPAPVAPPAPVVPVTPAPAYSQQDMAKACVQLMDLKGQPAIVSIMANFGVQALTQLPKERYNELAAVLRAEGVNI